MDAGWPSAVKVLANRKSLSWTAAPCQHLVAGRSGAPHVVQLGVAPGFRLRNGRHDRALRPYGARDDHHADVEIGGRSELGGGVAAAGVLRDQQIDPVVDQDPMLLGVRIGPREVNRVQYVGRMKSGRSTTRAVTGRSAHGRNVLSDWRPMVRNGRAERSPAARAASTSGTQVQLLARG